MQAGKLLREVCDLEPEHMQLIDSNMKGSKHWMKYQWHWTTEDLLRIKANAEMISYLVHQELKDRKEKETK